MRKGFTVQLQADEVKKLIEKALKSKNVTLPVLNEFTNTANANFPKVGYAWFSWREVGDGCAIMIESKDLDAAYNLVFAKKEDGKAAKKVTKKAKAEEKADNGSLPASKLGLTGKTAKAFENMTLGDVAKKTKAEILALPGVGAKTVEKIVAAMAEFGFEIK